VVIKWKKEGSGGVRPAVSALVLAGFFFFCYYYFIMGSFQSLSTIEFFGQAKPEKQQIC